MEDAKLEFGKYLRQLIKESSMSQFEFYSKLGIKKPYFYDILSGKSNPPPSSLQFKSVKILNLKDDEKREFFDLAAKGRKELPADIVDYLFENSNEIKKIRTKIKRI